MCARPPWARSGFDTERGRKARGGGWPLGVTVDWSRPDPAGDRPPVPEQYPTGWNHPVGRFAFLNKALEREPIAYRIGFRSRLRTHYRSKNVTVAAMQMAEKKVWAHLS